MKIFLTEVLKDNKMLVGPYIQAEDIEEAIEIADMYACLLYTSDAADEP